ncbi:hypothetical protein PY257_14315 [Ramlibacter sp. H39-3-26]|uniref:hypothetical protein n=1 Tax=Curvibacter soli TaxID=3031331 RepID=UPI0023DC5C47|nr:hypothetical protein [Ramlibacter sp. H39-3-26]MDF1486336.1 hypothetical protein [Ramlibacter sp. H39-3-26]
MTDFIIKKQPYDPSSNAGLALVGQYLKRIHLNALVDPPFPVRSGISSSAIARAMQNGGNRTGRRQGRPRADAVSGSGWMVAARGPRAKS